MLNFKYNVLYFMIAKRPENLAESIVSCFDQNNVNPFLFIACTSNEAFYEAKKMCINPIIYEPNTVISKNMIIVNGKMDEKALLANAISFGRKNNCKYYCMSFIHSKLNKDFSKRSIDKIGGDIIGCYSNMIDSGVKIYTNISGVNAINPGPTIFLKKELAFGFNHENIGDFLRYCVSNGCFYHFEEFLTEAKWIEFI